MIAENPDNDFFQYPYVSGPANLGCDYMAWIELVLDLNGGNYYYGPGKLLNSFTVRPTESLPG